jgi:hypothetical protein
LGFSLLVAALVLGLGWLLPRLGQGPLVTAGAQLVPVLLAFAITVLPAFRDVTVDESFPVVAPTATSCPASSQTSAERTAEVTGRASLHG